MRFFYSLVEVGGGGGGGGCVVTMIFDVAALC
jgi:hypothetical protein